MSSSFDQFPLRIDKRLRRVKREVHLVNRYSSQRHKTENNEREFRRCVVGPCREDFYLVSYGTKEILRGLPRRNENCGTSDG